MASRFLAALLVSGCLSLAGCGSADHADRKTASATPNDRLDKMPAIAELSEPSVRYLGSDQMPPAVVVAGHPLLYTRQILPVDGEGNLAGKDSTHRQIGLVLDNLQKVLDVSGSSLSRLVKVNVYADSSETIQMFAQQLANKLDPGVAPAICAVISPLPIAEARIAVDAVAIADEQGVQVTPQQCDSVASESDCADVAVMPRGGVLYLSGQADKSPLAEATGNSIRTLLGVIDQLKLQPSQIVQLKVFIDSASASDTVRTELKKLFPNQLLPPVSFVEWIASAPIEIEAVVHLPRESWQGGETLSFYTPAGVKPSPVFSKVAMVQTDRQVFISGLAARRSGGGADQVRDVFTQLQEILSACGSDLKQLAKATYYVSDKDASDMLNKLRGEYYDPQRPPAASKAMVHGVGPADRSIVIDMIAIVSDN